MPFLFGKDKKKKIVEEATILAEEFCRRINDLNNFIEIATRDIQTDESLSVILDMIKFGDLSSDEATPIIRKIETCMNRALRKLDDQIIDDERDARNLYQDYKMNKHRMSELEKIQRLDRIDALVAEMEILRSAKEVLSDTIKKISRALSGRINIDNILGVLKDAIRMQININRSLRRQWDSFQANIIKESSMETADRIRAKEARIESVLGIESEVTSEEIRAKEEKFDRLFG